MPRINVEDRLFSNPRFQAFQKMVGDEDLATGIFIRAVRLAQVFYLANMSEPGVPEELFRSSIRFSDKLLVSGLFSLDKNLVSYYAFDEFSWLSSPQARGKLGGRKSAELRKLSQATKLSLLSSPISMLIKERNTILPPLPPTHSEQSGGLPPVPPKIERERVRTSRKARQIAKEISAQLLSSVRLSHNEEQAMACLTEGQRKIFKGAFRDYRQFWDMALKKSVDGGMDYFHNLATDALQVSLAKQQKEVE